MKIGQTIIAVVACTAFFTNAGNAYSQIVSFEIDDDTSISNNLISDAPMMRPVSHPLEDAWGRIANRQENKRSWFTPSGWMNAGYTWNGARPASRRNGPIGFNDEHSRFQLNQLYLVLEASQKEDDNESWSWDARVDLLFGTDHDYTVASGLEVREDGSQRWNKTPNPATDNYRGTPGAPRPFYGLSMPQLYADLHTPLLAGMDIRMGHFYTNVGYESVMPLENFFYTHTMARIHGQPMTHTGMIASTKLFDTLDVSLGFTRGWDNWEDDSAGDLSITGGIGFEIEDNSFSVNFHTGDDFHGIDNNGNQIIGNVTIVTLNYTRNVTDKLKYALSADVGHGDGMAANTLTASLHGARWYGITNYLTYDIGEKLSTGLRVEWFRDQDNSRVMPGAFSSHVDGGNYVNVTMGLNYRHNDRWTFRPEARWDWSDTKSNDLSVPGAFGDFQQNDTFTLSLDAIFTF